MPAHLLYSFRHASWKITFIVIVFGFIFFSQTAYADPHAVFYTDRAQEQVFFNTLAALNQADFVEPGLADSTGRTREQLLGRRTGAALTAPAPTVLPTANTQQTKLFAGEENPLVTSTHTDLPGILSRTITLEGNDLWTAYLVNQLALETKTRRSASELARLYCAIGLGREGCSTKAGVTQQQDTAFIKDIETYNPEFLALVSALSSGAASEEHFRDRIAKPPSGTSFVGPLQEPVSKDLKTLRPNAKGIEEFRNNNESDKNKLALVNNITTSVLSSYFDTSFPSDALKDITLKDDGTVEIPKDIKADDYLRIASNIGSLLPATLDTAGRALEQGQEARSNRENTPSLAQTTLQKDEDGSVKEIVNVPSTAKLALIQEQAALIANSDINQKTAASKEITVPGKAPALQTTNAGQVAGISTADDPNRTGKVAGIVSDVYSKFYDQPVSSQNTPATGLEPPHEESGLYQSLQALTGDQDIRENPSSPKAQCGLCNDLDGIITSISGSSAVQGGLGAIQGFFNDIYCAILPKTQACIDQNP